MKYRADIDGLRALAIAPVVLFHVGFSLFRGGFVGVDVFFVISGYLITGIIYGNMSKGSFSFFKFYERRIRRIIPALSAVILSSFIAGYFILLPDQFSSFAKSVLATFGFAANIWFWTQAGYFQVQTETVPLLHMWSLAVEEQFYLFVPPVILMLARSEKLLKIAVAAAFLISLGLCIVMTGPRPSASFFLLPTRAWELLTGSMLALHMVPALRTRFVCELVAASGSAMLLLATLLIREDPSFPGVLALAPCLGAACVIHASKDNETYVSRFLSCGPVVALGLISYSLYLVHWPLLVFYRQYAGVTSIGFAEKIAIVLISIMLAWLSWRFIEQPFRDGRILTANIIKTSATIVASVSVLAALIISLHGLPSRFDAQTLKYEAGSRDGSKIAQRCGAAHSGSFDDPACRFGAEGVPTVLLVGDSHAGAISEGVERAAIAERRSVVLNMSNSCLPIYGGQQAFMSDLNRRDCINRNNQIIPYLKTHANINTVILEGHWSRAVAVNENSVKNGLKEIIKDIVLLKRDVVVFNGLPVAPFNVPFALARSHIRGVLPPNIPRSKLVWENLADEYRFHPRVRVLNIGNAFCGKLNCMSSIGGKPIFMDFDHLTETGSRAVIGPYLIKIGLFTSRNKKH